MSYNLNIFDMLRLSRRAKQDVKLDLFRPFYVTDSSSRPIDQFVISNFIVYELERFGQKRTDLQVCKRYWLWTPLNKPWLKRFRRLPMLNALTALNSAYAHVQMRIHLTYAQYNKTMDLLAEQSSLYSRDNAAHYARICYNQSTEARTKFEKSIRQSYALAVALLNQKIRILTKLTSKTELVRSRCLGQIRYYYDRAAARDLKLPVQFLSDERLSMVADLSTLPTSHIQELQTTYDLLKNINEEIDALFTSGKEDAP